MLSTVETLEAIRRQVDRLRTTEVSESEVQSARDTALNSLVFAFDTRTKTLGRILSYEYYGYPKDFIQQYQKALAAVTPADVLRVARERLAPANFTVVVAGNPDHFAKRLDTLGTVTPIDLTIPPASVQAARADAQTLAEARSILERARRAAGGTDKLAAVKDFTVNLDIQMDPAAGGKLMKETDRWIAPTYYREDTSMDGRPISAYCDGTYGWVASTLGSGPMTGGQLNQFINAIARIYFRVLLADRQPGWAVNAVDDSTIEIAAADQHFRVSFNPATGLPQRMVYDSVGEPGTSTSVAEEYSDFRDVGGIQVPFHILTRQGGRKFADGIVQDYKINTGITVATLGQRP